MAKCRADPAHGRAAAAREGQTLANLKRCRPTAEVLESMSRYGNPLGNRTQAANWVAASGRAHPHPGREAGRWTCCGSWSVTAPSMRGPSGQPATRSCSTRWRGLRDLGNDEKCAGECGHLTVGVRLFESLTESNVKTLKKPSSIAS